MGARKRRAMLRHLLGLLKPSSSSLTTTKPNPRSNNLAMQERAIAGRLTTAKNAFKTHLQSSSFSRLVPSKNPLLPLLREWNKPQYSLRRTSGWRRWWPLTLSKVSPIRQATSQTCSLYLPTMATTMVEFSKLPKLRIRRPSFAELAIHKTQISVLKCS